MIDKTNIVKDLKTRKYTQGEIAKRNNCSITTVGRTAKKFNLSPGRGVKNYWEFVKPSKELCYLIGAYLTDGYISFEYKTKKPRQFGLNCVDEEFAKHFRFCIKSIGLKYGQSINVSFQKFGHKPQFVTLCYSSMFAKWIYDITENKTKIPDFIFGCPKEYILEFVAACIDGDGSVEKDGSIILRCTNEWIKQFEDVLKTISIRTGGLKLERILESGKNYYRISIRRQDFRKLGGECKIKRKQDRILYGKEERTWRRPKRYKYVCPVCGQKIMSRRDAKMCTKCYHNSNELKQRLREQASSAGIAGNKVRWG